MHINVSFLFCHVKIHYYEILIMNSFQSTKDHINVFISYCECASDHIMIHLQANLAYYVSIISWENMQNTYSHYKNANEHSDKYYVPANGAF